jgi:hypothetical protein
VRYHVWLDDLRDPVRFTSEDTWTWIKTAKECIKFLEEHHDEIDSISLDNDLGSPDIKKSGYAVACWIEEHHELFAPTMYMRCHSANPVESKRIDDICTRYFNAPRSN